MRIILEYIGWSLFIIFVLWGMIISFANLAKENEGIRERQRAACVASGGKYATSLGTNSGPSRDYCIR